MKKPITNQKPNDDAYVNNIIQNGAILGESENMLEHTVGETNQRETLDVPDGGFPNIIEVTEKNTKPVIDKMVREKTSEQKILSISQILQNRRQAK